MKHNDLSSLNETPIDYNEDWLGNETQFHKENAKIESESTTGREERKGVCMPRINFKNSEYPHLSSVNQDNY